jgi:alpha-ribazole phosphatase
MLDEDGVLTIHLVRHGETLATREHRLCGLGECALSEQGRLQSEAIVESCANGGDWRAVYTSPLSRCRAIAEPVAERLHLPLSVESDLREIDHGRWDGRREEEVRESEPQAYGDYVSHPGIFAAPGGESGFQVAARALPVIERIRAAHEAGEVLVVSHEATIRIITCALLGIDIDLYRARLALPVASFTTIEFRSSGPLLRRLGDQAYGAKPGEPAGQRAETGAPR